MSDNIIRFRTIRNALNKLYPYPSQGNVARHLTTLAWMISGIVGSHSTHLPKIAGKAPDGNQVESRVKRFSRWVKNEKIETELYFMPFAQALLLGLSSQTLVLAIDGSVIGRGCIALMVNVIYSSEEKDLGIVGRTRAKFKAILKPLRQEHFLKHYIRGERCPLQGVS